jgi:cell division septation protein DedD
MPRGLHGDRIAGQGILDSNKPASDARLLGNELQPVPVSTGPARSSSYSCCATVQQSPRPSTALPYGTAADTSSAPGDGPDETPEMDEDRACRRGPAFARATVLLGWHSRRDRSVLLCSDARAAEHAITTSETGGPDELGNYTRGMSGLLLATVAQVLLDDAVSRRH